eukprot:GFUD01068969.1.p1 GENE.GFUD01068969.1~~GFUD01068969.1.p1  ORF type:complete len:489 (+),score=170.14 GFUD01068969.1:46-1512(+)
MAKKGKTPSSAKKAEVEASVEEVEAEAPVDEAEAPAEEAPEDVDDAAPEEEVAAVEEAVEEAVDEAIETPVTKKKKAAKAAAIENGVAEDAPVVNGDAAPAEAASEEKEEKKTPKKVKKVPVWASISDEARKNLSKSKLPKPKVQDAVLEAISACADSKGVASAGAIRKMVLEDNPDLSKMKLKKAVAKAIERGLVKQVKGAGFTGSFKLETVKNVAKASKAKAKGAKSVGPKLPPLESVFPGVFTWACNPKEASIPLIRKYIAKHYPELDSEGNGFKKALEGGESKGQLGRVTGKGLGGTFKLVDGADKNGAKYEDAFENAIISMSEPKQVSVNNLRDYLGEYHKEYNTDNRPKVLKNALDRSVASGWLKQITGKGFTGTYRLMYPYYPSPKELWGKDFAGKKEKVEKEEKAAKSTPKRKATKRAAVDLDSEEEEESDDEGEVMPTPTKRGAPTARKTAAPVKKVAKKAVAKKGKAAAPKKGRKSRK